MTLLFPFCLLFTDLLAIILLLPLHLLLLFLPFPKLLLLSLLSKPLILQKSFLFSLFSSSFPHSGPIVFPGNPPEFLILGSHFLGPVLPSLKLFSFLIVLYLPGLLLLLKPYLSFPLSLSPWPALGLIEGVVEDPGVHILGGEEPPEAEGAGPPPPPVARPLPFPAIFGLTINHPWSLLRVLLLMKPKPDH